MSEMVLAEDDRDFRDDGVAAMGLAPEDGLALGSSTDNGGADGL